MATGIGIGEPFSDQLERWLRSDGTKTLGALSEVFAEKSFAVTIVLLMFVPALPLPTGGISHVFEVITVVLAAEMVLGRRTVLASRTVAAPRARRYDDGEGDSVHDPLDSAG